MPFPEDGFSGSSGRTGLSVASTNFREGNSQEFLYPAGAITGRFLFYKFYPKFTGEIRIQAEVKSSTGAVNLLVAFTNRAANGTYLDAAGQNNAVLNDLVPVGTVYTVPTVNARYGELNLGGITNVNYTTTTVFLTVFQLTPFYFSISPATGGSDTGIRNFTINYDVAGR